MSQTEPPHSFGMTRSKLILLWLTVCTIATVFATENTSEQNVRTPFGRFKVRMCCHFVNRLRSGAAYSGAVRECIDDPVLHTCLNDKTPDMKPLTTAVEGVNKMYDGYDIVPRVFLGLGSLTSVTSVVAPELYEIGCKTVGVDKQECTKHLSRILGFGYLASLAIPYLKGETTLQTAINNVFKEVNILSEKIDSINDKVVSKLEDAKKDLGKKLSDSELALKTANFVHRQKVAKMRQLLYASPKTLMAKVLRLQERLREHERNSAMIRKNAFLAEKSERQNKRLSIKDCQDAKNEISQKCEQEIQKAKNQPSAEQGEILKELQEDRTESAEKIQAYEKKEMYHVNMVMTNHVLLWLIFILSCMVQTLTNCSILLLPVFVWNYVKQSIIGGVIRICGYGQALQDFSDRQIKHENEMATKIQNFWRRNKQQRRNMRQLPVPIDAPMTDSEVTSNFLQMGGVLRELLENRSAMTRNKDTVKYLTDLLNRIGCLQDDEEGTALYNLVEFLKSNPDNTLIAISLLEILLLIENIGEMKNACITWLKIVLEGFADVQSEDNGSESCKLDWENLKDYTDIICEGFRLVPMK